MTPRKILWLSDIHVAAAGKTIHGRDPLAFLRRALDHALRHHADADLMVISGDLVDERTEDEYRRVRDALSGLPVPVAMTIGNHDGRSAFRAVFPDAFRDGNGFVQGRTDVGPDWRCLLLDTNADASSVGALDRDRLAWLRGELEALDGRRCLIFMHHPPILLGLPGFDAIGLPAEDRAAFAGVIAAHRDRIGFVGFGHTHMTPCGAVAGVPAIGIGSTLYRVRPDFTAAGFPEDPGAPGVHGVVLLGDDGPAVHLVRVPEV